MAHSQFTCCATSVVFCSELLKLLQDLSQSKGGGWGWGVPGSPACIVLFCVWTELFAAEVDDHRRSARKPIRAAPQSTTQFGQDRFVLQHLFPPGFAGFFVELGASDGVSISNTLLLEVSGWTGLLVEASSLPSP